MVDLFEKVPKDSNNPYGIKRVKRENPFLQGPCVISILPYPDTVKEINGGMRLIADMVNPDIDQSVDPNKRIFGFGSGKYNEQDESFTGIYILPNNAKYFVSKYFLPLVTINNEKIDVYTAMKNVRNITLFSYCNGRRNVYTLLFTFRKELLECGYSETDANLILSQICIVSVIGTDMLKLSNHLTMINFGDIKDQFFDESYDTKQRIIHSFGNDNRDVKFVNNESYISCVTNYNSDHSLYRYVVSDENHRSLISRVLNFSLENALINKESDTVIPLTYEKIENELISVLDQPYVRNRKH